MSRTTAPRNDASAAETDPIKELKPAIIRRELLRQLLIRNEGNPMDLVELTELINSYLTPAAGGPDKEKGDFGHRPQSLRATLRKFKEEGEFLNNEVRVPRCKGRWVPRWAGKASALKVSGKVTLEKARTSRVDENMQSGKKAKRRLGQALWFELLGIRQDQERDEEEGGDQGRAAAAQGPAVTARKEPKPSLIRERVMYKDTEKKLNSLRARSALSVFFDSGSTTVAAARVLLNTAAWPLKLARAGGTPGKAVADHLILPHLTTNCPAIADMFSRSKHRFETTVRILGGDLRTDSASISGPLSEMCLKAWQQVHTDVAIVGTTAIQRWDEVMSFCSSDISEARIKTAVLENAQFRVVVTDCSKLEAKSQITTNAFRTLERGQVDLVLIDEPGEKASSDLRATFAAFKKAAQEAEISYVIVKATTSQGKEDDDDEAEDDNEENGDGKGDDAQ